MSILNLALYFAYGACTYTIMSATLHFQKTGYSDISLLMQNANAMNSCVTILTSFQGGSCLGAEDDLALFLLRIFCQ